MPGEAVLQKWEKALRRFLRDWQNRDEVIGALVTGSYAAGTATRFSDIDIHIVLDDHVTWRERGNVVVDGFLIEYFANPVSQILKYMDEDFKRGRRTDARMFVIGHIIFDKNGAVEELQKQARIKLRKHFPRPNALWIENSKYELWDSLDNLTELNERLSPNFNCSYYFHLARMISIYSFFLGFDTPPFARLYQYLTDGDFRKKYKLENPPDRRFASLIAKCMVKADFPKLKELTGYVLTRMGGFEINGWKLRSRVEI